MSKVHICYSNANLPFLFAKHFWFVVEDELGLNRYEVLFSKDEQGKYVYKNKYKPFQGIEIFPYFINLKWKGKKFFILDQDNCQNISELIKNIKSSQEKYFFRNTYRLLGPNSNTFVSNILQQSGVNTIFLPKEAVGKDYKENNPVLLEFYKIAKKHKENHKGCGAEPYLDYEYLYNFVNKMSDVGAPLLKGAEHERQRVSGDFNVLELGMGIGFTSIVMHMANPNAEIDTIETNGEHLQIAKGWINSQGLTLGKRNINIIQADVHNILPYLETNKYDFIFFDVYGPKEKFLVDFERILKPGWILYSVNSHLKSAEPNYFENLDNSKNWIKVDEFGDTKIYKKIT